MSATGGLISDGLRKVDILFFFPPVNSLLCPSVRRRESLVLSLSLFISCSEMKTGWLTQQQSAGGCSSSLLSPSLTQRLWQDIAHNTNTNMIDMWSLPLKTGLGPNFPDSWSLPYSFLKFANLIEITGDELCLNKETHIWSEGSSTLITICSTCSFNQPLRRSGEVYLLSAIKTVNIATVQRLHCLYQILMPVCWSQIWMISHFMLEPADL